jgi:hypothetical protein
MIFPVNNVQLFDARAAGGAGNPAFPVSFHFPLLPGKKKL